MKGKILDYTIQRGEGIISAEDGQRYNFTSLEWKIDGVDPKKNIYVDFVVDGRNATSIYVLEETHNKYKETPREGELRETSSAAIASITLGITGLFLDWWLFAIPSIIAIIMGHIARFNIKNSGGKLDGNMMAIIGLIMGYIVVVCYLVVTLIVVSFFSILSR